MSAPTTTTDDQYAARDGARRQLRQARRERERRRVARIVRGEIAAVGDDRAAQVAVILRREDLRRIAWADAKAPRGRRGADELVGIAKPALRLAVRRTLQARLRRREAAAAAEAARQTWTRSMSLVQDAESRRRAVAHQIGETVAGWLVDADVAVCAFGAGGQEVADWDRYSKGWHRSHGPARYRAAGVRVVGRTVLVDDSRGRTVGRWELPRARTVVRRSAESVGRQMLAAVSGASLDRIGPRGEDDRLTVSEPYRVCRGQDPEGRPAILVADRPSQLVGAWCAGVRSRGRGEPAVQVVVRDPATSERHHLTVPPEFGRPLAAGERARDRIRAAVAWTFDLAADAYSPAHAS